MTQGNPSTPADPAAAPSAPHVDEALSASIRKAEQARRASADAPYLAALRGETPSRRPVWMMRQAGRSLPEYRAIRADIGMLDSCFRPDLLAEITLQPVRRHDADAAILFSDIVVPLKAAGIDLDIVAGRGPVVADPVRSLEQARALPPVTREQLAPVAEGISGVLEGLRGDQVLIGFAGAPFTVASYLIEGGPSKNHEVTKSIMYGQPELWAAIMTYLTDSVISFLTMQVEAGVDALQLFDSWAGYLSARDYTTHVAPYSQRIFHHMRAYGIPMTHFGVTTGELLGAMAATGPTVMGIDYRVNLYEGAERIHRSLELSGATDSPVLSGIQGNLDPAVLFADAGIVSDHVARICAEADRAIADGFARGHIFNLGHGVLPTTDPDAITRTFEEVHAQ